MQVPSSPTYRHTPQRPRQQHRESPGRGSGHENQASDEDSANVNSGRERGQLHHQPPPTSPLRPHNLNVSRPGHSIVRRSYPNSDQQPSSSYRHTHSSPPPSSHNRDRSRSPSFHHAKSSPLVNRHRDYHNRDDALSSPVRKFGRR